MYNVVFRSLVIMYTDGCLMIEFLFKFKTTIEQLYRPEKYCFFGLLVGLRGSQSSWE